jgi:hypothetical protein
MNYKITGFFAVILESQLRHWHWAIRPDIILSLPLLSAGHLIDSIAALGLEFQEDGWARAIGAIRLSLKLCCIAGG